MYFSNIFRKYGGTFKHMSELDATCVFSSCACYGECPQFHFSAVEVVISKPCNIGLGVDCGTKAVKWKCQFAASLCFSVKNISGLMKQAHNYHLVFLFLSGNVWMLRYLCPWVSITLIKFHFIYLLLFFNRNSNEFINIVAAFRIAWHLWESLSQRPWLTCQRSRTRSQVMLANSWTGFWDWALSIRTWWVVLSVWPLRV